MACVMEGLNFKFHLLLINLNLNNHMWPVATILDSIVQRWKHSEKIRRVPMQAEGLTSLRKKEL